MKKILLVLFLILFSAFTLVACGDDVPTKEGVTEEPTTDIPTDSVSESLSEKYDCITIAEALQIATTNGSDAGDTRYNVYGVVKVVSNSMYGEMTIKDETGELYVYGTYSADGVKRYSELEEKPFANDEVVLSVLLNTHNDAPQAKSGWILEFNHIEVEQDLSQYTEATIAEARDKAKGEKVVVEGVVAQITYANGMVPNGFYLVDNTESIYVYGKEITGMVSEGNKVKIAGEKDYYVLETELNNANKHGYKGCNQLTNAILVENDKANNDPDLSWVPTSTVKDILENPVSNDITTTIFKVNAYVNKRPGNGFTNYYFNDIDGVTGSYTYTSCNGGDFSWLDEFDGEICTVYLSAINCKSTASGCVYRFIPIKVVNENYTFPLSQSADYALKYHVVDQFLTSYAADPALEVVTEVSNNDLGIDLVNITYTSNNECVSFVEEDGKLVMHTSGEGTAKVTVKATYKTYEATKELTIEVKKPVVYETITVAESAAKPAGEEVTIKGIVAGGIINQDGFYVIDETGLMAVLVKDGSVLGTLSRGDEVVVKGTRLQKVKSGDTTGIGHTCLSNAIVLANNYGNHDIPTNNFRTDLTPQQIYDLKATEQHSNEIYVITATLEFIESTYSSQLKVASGSTKLNAYCSGASQYSWLNAFAGKECELVVAICNWNSKNYYTVCILAATYNGETIYNNFNLEK